MIIYGIDFTSAPSQKKPITCVECTLDDKILHVNNLLNIRDFHQFEDLLQMDGAYICGIDFPFGQARKLVQNMGWPLSWEDYVEVISQMEKGEFEETIKGYCDSRPKGDKHHFRVTDKKASSCSPMTLSGTPVGKMFYQGAPRIMMSDASVLPFQSPKANKIIVEAYPKLVAQKWIGKRGYKSDKKQKQSEDQKNARFGIVHGLRSNELGQQYGLNINITDEFSR